MSENADDYPRLITQSYAETAARKVDFKQVKTMVLADGRELRV